MRRKRIREPVQETHFETDIYFLDGFEVTTHYDDVSSDMLLRTIIITRSKPFNSTETMTLHSKESLRNLISLLQHVDANISMDSDFWGV